MSDHPEGKVIMPDDPEHPQSQGGTILHLPPPKEAPKVPAAIWCPRCKNAHVLLLTLESPDDGRYAYPLACKRWAHVYIIDGQVLMAAQSITEAEARAGGK